VRTALQRVCNAVDMADNDGGRLGASASARNDADGIGGPNGERGWPMVELALHVCCTRADLIMSAAGHESAPPRERQEITGFSGYLEGITNGDEPYI
jgi:hypothetical protein